MSQNSEYKKRWRAKKISAGLCGACGRNTPREGLLECEACAVKNKARSDPEYFREHRRRVDSARKAAGLCYRCGNQAADGYGSCEICRALSRAEGSRRREKNLAAGLCACGRKPREGLRACEGCGTSSDRYHRSLDLAGVCTRCGKARADKSKFCTDCLKKSSERHLKWRSDIYESVLDGYGRKCACCGEDNPAFLTLDHINNDGCKERKENGGRSGYGFYKKVVTEGFPKHLQLLCYNCNCGKHRNGGICPHVDEWRAKVNGEVLQWPQRPGGRSPISS